jgi:transposase
MPIVKELKRKTYSHEIKVKAVQLHLEESWKYRKIMEWFEIPDRHILKAWMRKFKELGEFGLMDQHTPFA